MDTFASHIIASGFRGSVLRQAHPQRFKLAVPLANKTALAVVGVSDERLVFRVHAQHVGRTGFHAHGASRARDSIDLNAGHEMFPSRGKPDACAASGGPERRETSPAEVRPRA